ncbi:MAG: hypothetical protein R6X02_26675 [Enhygromyxa sp.]
MQPTRVRRQADLYVLDQFDKLGELGAVMCTSLVTNRKESGAAVRGREQHPPNVVGYSEIRWERSGSSIVITRLPNHDADTIVCILADRPGFTEEEKNNSSLQPKAKKRIANEMPKWEEATREVENLFIKIYSALSRPLPEPASVTEVLARVTQDFEAQIATLRSTAISLSEHHVSKIDEYKLGALEEVKAEQARLRTEYEEKDRHRIEELQKRENALKEREAQLDTQDAKSARRQRRIDLLRQLFFDKLPDTAHSGPGPARTEGLTLETAIPMEKPASMRSWFARLLGHVVATPKNNPDLLASQLQVRGRRLVGTSVFLMATFAGAEIVLFYLDAGTWQMWSARAAVGLAFATTTSYLLRWLDIRYRHVEEDQLYRRRLSFDISRAEWLVETLLEYGSERDGAPIPPEVITALAQGLFSNVKGAKGAHVTDEVAKALRGKIKMSNGDQTIEFERP